MSNDWTNKLRDRLADYQEPVMDDLWAGIEQSLAHESHKAHQSRQVWMRRFSVAAAIAALAVGGAYVYLHPWDEAVSSDKVASLVRQTEQGDAGKGHESNMPANPVKGEKIGNPAKEEASPMNVSVRHFNGSRVLSEGSALSDVSSAELRQEDSFEAGKSHQQENSLPKASDFSRKSKVNERKLNESKTNERKLNELKTNEILLASSYDIPVSKKSHDASWSVQFYGENGVVASNGTTSNVPLVASAAPVPPTFYGDDDLYRLDNAAGKPGDFETKLLSSFAPQQYYQDVKHHHPISVGMQVGFVVYPRLRLNTGLVYTNVSSDFIGTVNDDKTVTKQTLHYIGVPLNLNYEVWGTKNFHAYVTAGGEGAVNVKNHTEADGVETDSKRDRMQWSVNGSVGAQYDFIPQLGLYVEPGVKYYFDNGSKIENAFKDKKTNFNLQLGLRWNIGK